MRKAGVAREGRRVEGALAGAAVVQVAAGAEFTVALLAGGRVFQMGATGTSARAPWEGALLPQQVASALLSLPARVSLIKSWPASLPQLTSSSERYQSFATLQCPGAPASGLELGS